MKLGDTFNLTATVTRVDEPFVDLEILGNTICVKAGQLPDQTPAAVEPEPAKKSSKVKAETAE